MNKYSQYDGRLRTKARTYTIHPIWRGIGCILMLLIPVLSFAGAIALVQQNLKKQWFFIPFELSQPVFIPGYGSVNYLFAYILIAVLLMLLGFGLMIVVYSLAYKFIGPPQYTPLDSPPIRQSPSKRR